MTANDQPFALLITWTCYGTWLPGDKRGHVSNVLRPTERYEKAVDTPGTPFAPGDSRTRSRAASLQNYSSTRLSPAEASTTANSLIETAAAYRWSILRAAIMFNHVHVVVCNCPGDGPEIRRLLKGRAHADLSRSSPAPRRWWTQGGSDRYLNDESSIAAAVRYVATQPKPLAEIAEGRIVNLA